MKKALSYDMEMALKAIKDGGHVVYPGGGGWWNDSDGNRLIYPPKPGSTDAALGRAHEVKTTTIYALATRGHLVRVGGADAPDWKAHYVTKEWME